MLTRQKYDLFLCRRRGLIDVFTQNKIECRPIVAGNFTRNPVIKWFDYEIFGELKNADQVHDYGLFVGNHQYNIDEHVEKLHKIISDY